MTREEMKKRDSEPRRVRLYELDHVASLLSEKEPFFRMSNGIYAVQTRTAVGYQGGRHEKPISFRRVDKIRGLKGKAKVRAQKEARRRARNAEQFKTDALS